MFFTILSFLLSLLLTISFQFKCGINDLVGLPTYSMSVSSKNHNRKSLRHLTPTTSLNSSEQGIDSDTNTTNETQVPECIYVTDEDNITYYINDEGSEEEIEYSPIRIYIDYTAFRNQGSSNTTIKTLYERNLNRSVHMFEKLLKVRRLEKLSFINQSFIFNNDTKYCQVNKTNPKLLTEEGIQADIVIFPIFRNLTEGVEASASFCIQEKYNGRDGRPIAGFVLLNPNYKEKRNGDEYITMLLLHELTHVFVFHTRLFENFTVNPIGYAYINGENRTILKSPKLLKMAREFYNCSNMTGVELENQGGNGTVGSHWETRTMIGEYMIGADYGETLISEMTLALFEDSGWYKVNYYTGGLFRTGKAKGCKYVQQKCIDEQGEPISSNEYCVNENEEVCLGSKTSRGNCYIKTGLNITNENYMYFANETDKGGYEAADYCPVPFVNSKTDSHLTHSCLIGINSEHHDFGETIGNNTICFVNTLVPREQATQDLLALQRANCFEIKCNYRTLKYTVKIGNSTVTCEKNGGIKEVKNYKGKLICPEFFMVCTADDKKYCNDPIQCVENEVKYFKDTFNYTGYDTDNTRKIIVIDDEDSSNYGEEYSFEYFLKVDLLVLIFCIISISIF